MKAILFDLDGTLLPIDTEAFLAQYMKALVSFMAPELPKETVKVLPEYVLASTYAMIANADPSVSNARAFWDDFVPRTGMTQAALTPAFDRFYEQAFPGLKEHLAARLPGMARAVVAAAAAKGYDLVLATNPVFPRVAIEERMRWIEITDFPWRLVTAYEEMHFCKPQPGYFLEICDRIGVRPAECLMIGNDVTEDGVAAKVGMHTFFVTDHLINKGRQPVDPNRSGSLADLLDRLNRGALPLG